MADVPAHAGDEASRRRARWTWIGLGLILALGMVLRFWKIWDQFHFMGDEGTESRIEWRLLHGHLPLLGPSLSIGRMHLGPLFYYLAAGPLWVAQGSPVGPTVFVAACGLGAIAMLYVYLKPEVGHFAALGAAAAMAASFLMVEYSRRPWNPTPTPLFTIAFLYSLVRWKRGGSKWLVVAVGTLSALLQLQPVNVFLVVLVAGFVVVARPPRPSLWTALAAAAIGFVLFLPLIIYDAGHKLADTRAWLAALGGHTSHASAARAASPKLLFNLFERAFGLPLPASVVVCAVVVIGAVGLVLRRRRDEHSSWEITLPLALLLIAAIGFEVYRKEVFEQYLVCLFVAPFMLLGALLHLLNSRPPGRIAGAVLVLILVAAGTSMTWHNTFVTPRVSVADASVTRDYLEPDDTYSHVRRVDSLIVRWAHGQKFRLRMVSSRNTDTAYRYQLDRMGQRPRSGGGLIFLLLEPPNIKRRTWPGWARELAKHPVAHKTIGIASIFEANSPHTGH